MPGNEERAYVARNADHSDSICFAARRRAYRCRDPLHRFSELQHARLSGGEIPAGTPLDAGAGGENRGIEVAVHGEQDGVEGERSVQRVQINAAFRAERVHHAVD